MNKWIVVVSGFVLFGLSACSVNKAKIDNDLKEYFDAKNVDGCFTMLNNSDGQITVYNMNLDTTRVTPASTFKILNALIGLETGIITTDTMLIPWDKVVREKQEWNKDMGMKEAFSVSSVPYFQEVARRIGKDSMQRWVDSVSYGNRNLNAAVDQFWLNNTLKISPDEQLGFMKKLYFDQLPFRKSVQQIVRTAMLREDNTAYKLSYKTGLGLDENNNSIGWVVGWVEENNHVYLFSTLIKAKGNPAGFADARLAITKDILKSYGFFEGKR